ncbi:hypothetical protein NVP3058O_065 [Vibrio phage 3.058.O._10N.286.46.B8]|nr:hypothetical protein NVP3058O_065 [Vibrio phage 3.058.O._10N.286.46.B8]
MSYCNERAKRKGIAKAVTNQCGIGGDIGYYDITIVDQNLVIGAIDVEFTINGKDGDVFCAKLQPVTFCGFGKRYDVVGMVILKEPEKSKHNHEAFVIVDCGACTFTEKPLRVYNTTMTRKEWLDSLFESGTIHERNIEWPIMKSHYPLHIGLVRYHRGEPRTEYMYGGRPVYNTLEEAVAECAKLSAIAIHKKVNDAFERSKLTMHDIWGITPISKEPVLVKSIAATSFREATRKLHDTSGYGTTVVHGEVHYNDRPVFPTQEAAKNWLALYNFSNAAISAGDLMAEISKTIAANAKKKLDDAPKRKTYTIWGVGGVGVDTKPTKLGDEQATTFEIAKRQLCTRWDIRDTRGRSKYMMLVGLGNQHSFTYLGHPVFESESEAQAYIYAEVKPKTRKVTELPCFKSVSDVIGKQSAMCELFKVMNTPECHLDLDNPNIVYAFNWSKTPQGNDHWYGVDTLIRINMEEARKHIYVDLNGERDFVMPGCSFGADLVNSPDKSVYFTVSVPKNRK